VTTSLVLINARLWSPDGAGTGCDAIVAEGARITALTSTVQARAQAGPGTRVIDLGGRLAIPAFGDAHVHPVGGGLESLRCDLIGPRDRARYLRIIADCARPLGPDDWVLGGGWSMEAFPGGVPPAADLVEAAGGRPVFLPNRDHHSAWVSPAALARAGITRDTPDPPDGRIERDSAGEPSGTLHDGAMRLVSRLIAPPTPDELAAGLRAGQRHLHALGITHWQDAIVGEAPDIGIPDALDTYRRAAEQGWLTGRVNGALWWDRRRGLEQIPDLLARREQAGTGVFQATSVKLMLDGVCETLTAAMTEPYTRPGGDSAAGPAGHAAAGHSHRGDLFVPGEEAAEAVRLLSREGFQVHMHAIGDRAVHAALDAVAAAAGPGTPKDLRHHIAHLQFIRPEDLDRFADLGVVANFQPLWAAHEPQMDELTLPFVGPERARWQYLIGTLARRGTRLAFGSDWPVSSADPLQEIHVAVNRRLSDRLGRRGTPETERPFLPAEALPLAQSLAAFTTGVAYVNHREHELGLLRPGHRADIAVLSQDIFAVPPSEIGHTQVDLTIASGQIVYEAPNAPA
jgi:hypothetical protein